MNPFTHAWIIAEYALIILLAFALGWWAGRRAPDGIEYKLWLKTLRRYRHLTVRRG